MSRIAVVAHTVSHNKELRARVLERYADVRFNEKQVTLKGEELIASLRGCEKAIVALERIDGELLDAVPELRVICKLGVGLNSVDLKAMADRNVSLGWRPGVNSRSVAELALAFMLVSLRHLMPVHRDMLAGNTWNRYTGKQLSERAVGIIGCGHIGKELVRLLLPFGCRILVNDIRDYPEFFSEHGIEKVGLEQLLRESEIVSIHTPLDDSTRNLMGAERIGLMRGDAILINTARGEIVDEAVLKHALQTGKLAGAAFDVFAIEPLQDMELIHLPNFFAAPHLGANTTDALMIMGAAVID
ncbi:MAG: phosphoglycerate dehydrogenase, partial [Rhodospirillales bacterium]|nr:phosphoglycerate dehydrogenase [Rhodospirillales bacterium]